MNAIVTLEEVLAAAATRAASLVPETSGYLALAIGDATARLPLRVRDGSVQLTTEGTVTVARGKEAIDDAEAAFVLRDILARLLSVSTGSMRGLTAAARPRSTNDRSLDTVLREIEAALIPVNRAAARRALARVARETLRAKETGALGAALAQRTPASRKATASRAKPVDAYAASSETPAPCAPRPAPVAVEASRLATPIPPPSREDDEWDDESLIAEGEVPDEVGVTPTEIGMSLVTEDDEPEPEAFGAQPEPEDLAALSDLERGCEDDDSSAPAVEAPEPPEALVETVQLALPVDFAAEARPEPPDASVEEAPRQPSPTPPPLRDNGCQAPSPGPVDPLQAGSAPHSRVHDLLDRFAGGADDDVAMRMAARSLRAFAGLDATPPPIGVVTLPFTPLEIPRANDEAETDAPDESGPRIAVDRTRQAEAPALSSAPVRSQRPGLALPLLLVALGLAGTVAWHFQETLRTALSLSRL